MKFLDKKFQSRFSATFCPPVKLEVRHILLICIGIFFSCLEFFWSVCSCRNCWRICSDASTDLHCDSDDLKQVIHGFISFLCRHPLKIQMITLYYI